MIRRIFPWLGLALLAVSFIWFVQLPQPAVVLPQVTKGGGAKAARLVVVLDPGHGGADSGAICGAVVEKDLTLDVARRAKLLLADSGFKTLLTRSDDRYLSLPSRAAVANREKHSLFVSIHFNDGERAAASGVETYFAPRQSNSSSGILAWLGFLQPAAEEPLLSESEKLAGILQSALVTRTRAINRGTKTAQFYVIANVRHPAALVEGGFVSNPSDVTKLMTPDYRQEIAEAISEGVRQYEKAPRPNEPALALAGPQSE